MQNVEHTADVNWPLKILVAWNSVKYYLYGMLQIPELQKCRLLHREMFHIVIKFYAVRHFLWRKEKERPTFIIFPRPTEDFIGFHWCNRRWAGFLERDLRIIFLEITIALANHTCILASADHTLPSDFIMSI